MKPEIIFFTLVLFIIGSAIGIARSLKMNVNAKREAFRTSCGYEVGEVVTLVINDEKAQITAIYDGYFCVRINGSQITGGGLISNTKINHMPIITMMPYEIKKINKE